MPQGGKPYPSLAELARNNPDQYRGMPVDERLAMLQGPYFSDRESMSPEDLRLFQLLSQRRRQEQGSAPQDASQLAPQGEGPGALARLFQFFSGRQAVDPLEQLKKPGYSGPASR